MTDAVNYIGRRCFFAKSANDLIVLFFISIPMRFLRG